MSGSYPVSTHTSTRGQQAHTLPCVRCGTGCRVFRDDKLWMACASCRRTAADDVRLIGQRLYAEVEARMADLPKLSLRAGLDAWQERHALVRATWADVTQLHLAGVAAA